MSERFSVIVPTYRRPEKIASCLEALAAQDFPRDRLEVVVVEDDGPSEELAELRERPSGDLDVRWLAQPHAGPAVARNLGARHAAGSRLAFTDDDCRPRGGWLTALDRALSPGRIVGGHTVNALPGNVYSSASQALVSFITGAQRREPFFASNNVALARADFERMGGFDEGFPLAGGEDREFCDRCREFGMEFEHVPGAVIDHYHSLDLRSFLRQHFRYGRGAYQFHRARAGRKGTTPLQDLTEAAWPIDYRFYLDLIRYPFAADDVARKLPVSMFLLVAQVPNALGFFVERARARAPR